MHSQEIWNALMAAKRLVEFHKTYDQLAALRRGSIAFVESPSVLTKDAQEIEAFLSEWNKSLATVPPGGISE